MPVFLFLLFFAAPLSAQVRWGARAGIVDGEPMIGADMVAHIGPINFNPNVEISGFGFTTNADAHYPIELTVDASVWVGAGIALVNPEGGDLDAGVNLLAGAGKSTGRYIFYTQLKRTAPADGDSFNSVAVGMRF